MYEFDGGRATRAMFGTQDLSVPNTKPKRNNPSYGFFGNLLVNIPAGLFLIWLGTSVPLLGAVFVIGAVVMAIRYLFTGSTE